MSDLSKYGDGKNPPYSLYQNEEGLWGLIDGSGNKLPAKFNRGEKNCFSCVPWEVVTFDENEGFELLAWYDPCEVWFNFTFDDPAYPEEYGHFLWKEPKHNLGEYSEIIYSLLPDSEHWLIDDILQYEQCDKSDSDFEVIDNRIAKMLAVHSELSDAATTNKMIDLIMRNENIDTDLRHLLWCAKVSLDNAIRNYLNETEQ